MKLKRLIIHRMPGFPNGGPSYDDLADGLNVIVGPNASGKTTTCEAIRGLLWEKHLEGRRPVFLESAWTDGDDTILIDREANNRVCQRDGKLDKLADLPPKDLARCFTITIDDLFEIDDTKRAEAIVQALAGGYDLPEVRGRIADFKKNPAKKAHEECVEAKRNVRKVQQAHEELHGKENNLSDLRRQVQDADKAKAQLDSIKNVRELNVLLGEIDDAEALLASFPPGMDRLGGKENESLATLRSDLADAEKRLLEALGDVDEQESRQTEAGLPEGGIASERLAEQQRHLIALRDAERNVEDAKGNLGEAEKKRNNALRHLAAIDADRIDTIDTTALDDIETFHRSYQTNHDERSAAEARLALIDEDQPAGDVVVLAQGTGILREWLEAGPVAAHDTSAKRNAELVLVLSALLGLTAVTFALTVSAWWAALLVPAVVAVIVARRGRPKPQSDCRAERQAAFGRTGLEEPDAWSPDAVGRRIGKLEQAIANAHQAAERTGERRSLQQRLEQLAAEAEELNVRRKELSEQLGLEAIGTLALTDLATNLSAFRKASQALAGAQGRAKSADDDRCERLDKISAFLAEFELGRCDTYDDAQASFDGLKKRAEQYADAGGKLLTARNNAKRARKDIQKYTTRKGKLFESVGLNDDDDVALAERLGRLGAYHEARSQLLEIDARARGLKTRLVDAADLTDLTPEALEQRAFALKDEGDKLPPLREQIATIKFQVGQAKEGHSLTDALAAVEGAEAAVDEQRTAALRAAAGAFLLDEIEVEYRAESEPPVLARAREWFSRFTHHRYELQTQPDGPDGQPTFRARETTTGRGLGLDELSRGTRMQLLLAVRLAFAAAAEQGTQLPFILDEVLSSSDPERFRAIVDCLLVLVREGRQVFYFTCQPGDAKAWSEAAEAAGIDEARLIDLGEARRDGPVGGPLSESTIRIREIPAINGATLNEYARTLGAASLNPTASAAGAHLAHFVDTPDQLHALAKARIETVGQLRSLADHGQSNAYIATDALTRVLAQAELLDAFADAWAVGRGRPVTREDLTAAGVTEKFIDAMAQLGRDLDWDTERLIEAVECGSVKGFGSGKSTALKKRLLESEHLSNEEPLDEDAARARVLAAANAHVNAGILTVDEVGRLFATWWQMCADGEEADCSETS